MSKYIQGTYQVKNKEKYVGQKDPFYRSSWEKKVFQEFDENPSVLKWGSEILKIPYQNPLTKQFTIYIPDLMIEYIDKYQKHHIEVIEIKPARETLVEFAKTKKDLLSLAVNEAKWRQARKWCAQKGINFRVMTEKSIFGISKNK